MICLDGNTGDLMGHVAILSSVNPSLLYEKHVHSYNYIYKCISDICFICGNNVSDHSI